MKAFYGDPAVKEKYLARVRAHREADQLVRGTGWDDATHRGCAIGCTLDAYDHSRYPTELGIPERVAHLEDWLFEHMPVEDALAWPERVLVSIKEGADLSRVWPEFAIWMLTDPEHDMLQHAGDRVDVRAAIEGVAALYRRTAVSREEWIKVGARAAAEAAEAAAEAARAASRTAGLVAAARASRTAGPAWVKVAADKLIELLEGAV